MLRSSLVVLLAAVLRAQDPAPPAAPAKPRVEVGFGILTALGTSTARDDVLAELEGGGHDPRQRGFTLQQAELSLAGEIDSWCTAQAFLVAFLDTEGETVVELEEAYATARHEDSGLRLDLGAFFAAFGRSNQQHPHEWDWQNQPVVNTRVFGGDGMRGPGARLAWRPPALPSTELTLGVHNGDGETMPSFLASEEVYAERPIGGRFFTAREVRSAEDLVYTLRATTTIACSAATELGLGASAAIGPNATGGDTGTVLWGADFGWRWQPEPRGHAPFVVVQGEVVGRAFEAAPQVDAADPLNPVPLPGATLDDWGGHLHVLGGFAPGWAAGLRAEWATGAGDSYDAATRTFARAGDPYRCDRLRISPLLSFRPSPSWRFRLQYDYDESDAHGDAVHSVWLGCEVRFGSHAGHDHGAHEHEPGGH